MAGGAVSCPSLCLARGGMPSGNRTRTAVVVRERRGVELSSSFVNSWQDRRRMMIRGGGRRGKGRRRSSSVIVSEVAGQYEDGFEDVKLQILNYFTYKAVRTVMNQLYEMNPTQYRWFYDFVVNNKPGDGKRFLRTLGKERHELAERVMVTRLHLYAKWIKEDFENFWSECPWDEDLKYAKAVCDQVNVPLEVVHLTDEYWNNVVSYIIQEYRCGRTPNPDVLCNTRIKFGAFMDAISSMNFDYVASGHYAKVVHPSVDHYDKPSVLELSMDMVKDQTYFLSHLSQAQLKRLIFPLGGFPKNEVRELATKFDLPNKNRKDSQGICFLGKIKFSEFVARHIGEMEGLILEAETGDFLGKHRGFWFYTIGQRQGLRLPGGPWYVVEKDIDNNVVFVSRNYFSVDKRRRIFRVGSLNWVTGVAPDLTNQLQCKVRHGPGFYSCKIITEHGESSSDNVAVVHLSEDDQGLAAGQFTAFYIDSCCVGSGVILESWDDQGFPICARALDIAKMEDKSKIGKPVKIKVQPETRLEETHLETRSSKATAHFQKSPTKTPKSESHQHMWSLPTKWLQRLGNKLGWLF